MAKWQEQAYPARLYDQLDNGVVRCRLSPRNCKIRPGQHGFCMVRANHDGHLVSLNYGRSVHATQETIETEAVNHYAPGEPILSMGNIGCMLNCDYCHNWKTSQARFVSDSDVYYYTPQEVVDIALRHGIRVLSWTYNDPVVWHEFVTETAALGRQAGLINLFKSAFFISPEAIEELLPVIDIFSISVKSMDPRYYRKLTKGWIEPVLEGTRIVHRAGKHVEVSTLMVTDLSDNESTARDMAEFVGEQLDPGVPLHFVRFHPDYKMTDSRRTPVDRLHAARRIALDAGIRHVYLGNVFEAEPTTTWCHYCGHRQVSRYGLNAQLVGINENGECARCGKDAEIKLMPPRPRPDPVPELPVGRSLRTAGFSWHGDVRSLHVQVRNDSDEPATLYTRRLGTDSEPGWRPLELIPGESFRFIASQATPGERGFEAAVPPQVRSSLHEVFDRAHFPTVEAGAGSLHDDVSPLPSFETVSGRKRQALPIVTD